MTNTKKKLLHWRTNAEENYITTPISVLKYITELENFNTKVLFNSIWLGFLLGILVSCLLMFICL